MRRLVVCCDGTWTTADRVVAGVDAPTNVVKIARAIVPEPPAGATQIVYYDPGIGTDNLVDRFSGGALGVGLSRNVRDAYLFLIHNYMPGDEIFFFGFSRGAYTVRSTAGLLRKVGILRKEHADQALRGWEIYRETEGGADSPKAQQFRNGASFTDFRIRFVGVWDTVGAMGIPGALNFIGRKRFQFHDVALSRLVDFAYQALAVDEQRKFFAPAIWEQHPDPQGQVMEQAWFTGVHMDAGGGYSDATASNVPLHWMADKAKAAGLVLDQPYLDRWRPDPLGPIHESRSFPYTVIPAFARPIGAGVPPEIAIYPGGNSHELVHPSVWQRYDADPSYRPGNLLEYIRRHGR